MSKYTVKTSPRPPKHKQNGLEARYAEHLDMQFRAKLIKGFGFQRYTLRLADDTRYTPDFHIITLDDRLIYDEVKGFMREDANVKIKVAADTFPHLFRLVTWSKAGGWQIKEM